MELKFFRCEHCGNIIEMVEDKGVPVVCCGQRMTELVAGTSDGAREKHVPVYEVKDNIVHVKVGEVAHPMIPEHYIEWIVLQTKNGVQRKELNPGDKPEACFALCDGDEVEAVYAYCNLHGLWKA
ncbi:MAG: desulfoferrodoxin [Oscillospiraceae bacterium]|nr:desulfoferrodoxin [Oscillospiraceae bacterium]